MWVENNYIDSCVHLRKAPAPLRAFCVYGVALADYCSGARVSDIMEMEGVFVL